MKQSKNSKMWTRKTGEIIAIKKMEDMHIIRVMRCLEDYAAERERRLRRRLSVVINDSNASHQSRVLAIQKVSTLDADGYPIGDVWIQYPKLCEEAVNRGLLV